MVEYEIDDSGISQVLSQDDVDQAALIRRDGFAFPELVRGVLHLRLCEVVGQDVLCQCSEGSTAFSILCKCAVSTLCSSAVRLGVLF